MKSYGNIQDVGEDVYKKEEVVSLVSQMNLDVVNESRQIFDL